MNELLGWYGFDRNIGRLAFGTAKGKCPAPAQAPSPEPVPIPVTDDTINATGGKFSSSGNKLKNDDSYRPLLLQPQQQQPERYQLHSQRLQQRLLGTELTPLGSVAEQLKSVVGAHCSERLSNSCHLSSSSMLGQSQRLQEQRYELLPLLNANNLGNKCHLQLLQQQPQQKQQHCLSHPCEQQQQSGTPLLVCCSRNHQPVPTANDGNNSDAETGNSSKEDDDDPKSLSIAVVAGSSSSSSSYATNQTAHNINIKNEKVGKWKVGLKAYGYKFDWVQLFQLFGGSFLVAI